MNVRIVPAAVMVIATQEAPESRKQDAHAVGQCYIHTENDTYTSVNPLIGNYNGEEFRRRFRFIHPSAGLHFAQRIVDAAELQLALFCIHWQMLQQLAQFDVIRMEEMQRRADGKEVCRRVLELAYEGLRSNQKEASTGV